MQTTIWESIADTPWWSFLTVIGFIGLAWLATKPKTVPVKNLFIVPAIYIPLSLLSVYLTLPLSTMLFLNWIGAALVGAACGWLHFRLLKIKALQNEASLYIPGTYGLFIIILLIAVSKYYYNYSLILDTQRLMQAQYADYIVALYGFFAGLFIGKIAYSLRCIKTGPFVSLS